MARKRPLTLRIQMETDMSIDLEMMGFLETVPGWKGDRHGHAFWELVFMDRGRGRLIYDKTTRLIQGGDLFLFPPHVPHQFVPDPNTATRHLYIGFTVSGGFPHWPAHQSPPFLDKQDTADIKAALETIVVRLDQHKEKAQLERCAGDLLSVLLKLLAGLVPGAASGGEAVGRSAILTGKIKAYLDANLDRRFTVRELAASFYLSPHYFGDLFKAHTGMTIKAYHNHVRLNAAADLMRDPDMHLSRIADTLGYNSIHYFSRKFKQHFGISPSEYRDKLGQAGTRPAPSRRTAP